VFYKHEDKLFADEISYPSDYDFRPYLIAANDLNEDNLMEFTIVCYDTN